MMRANQDQYLALLQSLLPQGEIWPRSPEATLTKLLQSFSKAIAANHNRAIDLIDEVDPRTTSQLLTDWERVCNLPDNCSAATATTAQERRDAVVTRLAARGGQSLAYFREIAEQLGYQVEFTEYHPFTCGRSKCGDSLNGTGKTRYIWKCTVTGPRITRFKCGASRCGEKLGKISRAQDLECLFHKLKPAHTKLIFGYSGV